MQNKYILESLASDLKRVALGLHRGSFTMADRFSKEALKRRQELKMDELKPYMKTLLNKLDASLVGKQNEKKAEDALMYSTLIQNYTTWYNSSHDNKK